MNKLTFLYCASEAFSSRAKVLTDSIKKYHPEDDIIWFQPEGDLPLGQYVPNMAKNRLIEALVCLRTSTNDVAVIGADCELFQPLLNIHQRIGDVFLVPHVKSPLEDREYMKQIYATGHANADLMIFKNNENSKNILKWLISVTEDGASHGEFYEQTWLSSLPFLFDGVHVIREPGYNVGYWDVNHINLQKRDIYLNNIHDGSRILQGEVYTVKENKPLVMVQYSGYVKGQPEKMSRHSKEFCVNKTVLGLYEEYDRRIQS